MAGEDPARDLENFRHRTLRELEHQLSDRDLPREEYDRRVALALRATSPGDLRSLLSDLDGPSATASAVAPAESGVPTRDGDTGDSDFVLAVMSGASRQGHWDPPETINALALMGGIKLDFRSAALLDGVTEVHAWAVMGGIEIYVPPDVHVSVAGFGFMGGFGGTRSTAPDPGAPRIHVDGLALMGGVEVKVREPGQSDDDED